MFVFTAKITRKKLVAAVMVLGLFLCGIILLVANAASGAPQEASAPTPVTKGIRSNDDRIGFLSSHGWTAGAQASETQEVRIPETFDEVLENYNSLQVSQGFDLTRYRGKRVMRYTYEILNYPSGQDGVFADLLIYKNEIIGGDVHTNELGGFMHGFSRPEACTCPADCVSCPPDCTCTNCPGDALPNDTLSEDISEPAIDEQDVYGPDGGMPAEPSLERATELELGYISVDGGAQADEEEPEVIEPR